MSFTNPPKPTSKSTATAYVNTWLSPFGPGHSSVYVKKDGTNEHLEFSVYPRRADIPMTHLLPWVPIRCSRIDRSLERDIQVESGSPDITQKIEGLDYDKMKDFHTDFAKRTSDSSENCVVFKTKPTGLVYFGSRLFAAQLRKNQFEEKNQIPIWLAAEGLFADTSLSSPIRVRQYNCAMGAKKFLAAGGQGNGTQSSTGFRTFLPKHLVKELDESGAKRLNRGQLPPELQRKFEKGDSFYKERQDIREREEKMFQDYVLTPNSI